jgi:nucleoside-diphosphate-sugar epimerase
MKILLTGGTGFIGSHFLQQALAAGHTVLALRRSTSSTPRIPIAQQPDWLDRQLDEVRAKDIQGCEALVHLAAHSVQYPFDSLANCLRWNLISALALFEQARLAGIRRFVVAGSCFEYGRSGERYDAIPTDAPLQPTNSYAVSKAAASIAIRQWAEENQLSLDIMRLFHVYGEGEPESRFWPSLRRAAFSGEDFLMTAGEQIRDFMPVEDVARVFLQRASITDVPALEVSVKNLSSSHIMSIREFARHWWNHWHAEGSLVFGAIPYRDGEVMHLVPGPELLCTEKPIDSNP